MFLSEIPLEQIRSGFTIVKSVTGTCLGIVASIDPGTEDYDITIIWGALHPRDNLPKYSVVWHFQADKLEVIKL